MNRQARLLLGLVAVAIAYVKPVHAQPATTSSTAAPAAFDAETTIAAARQVLADRYVLPDVGAKLDQALAGAATAGVFRGLAGEALAARVNAEMSKVTSDVHLQMQYRPQLAALLEEVPVESTPDRKWDEALESQYQRTNGGVRKLEVLPGNIRYLAYNAFAWGAPAAHKAIATAMEFLRDGDAIIIDLRNNPGGSTYAEAAIASYFLPPQSKLTRFEIRGEPGETTETSTAPFSIAGKPTFVLIGPATASAAEWLALHGSTFGFGTLVGAKTRGGGYTIRAVPLPGGYVLNVSVGRALDAQTGADLEGVGVAPEITVTPDKALAAAQAAAMERLLTGVAGPEREQGARLLAFYRAQVYPIAAALPADDYAGTYGDFTVETRQGDLTIRYRDFSPEVLTPVASHIYAAESEPLTQVRFVLEGATVVALALDGGNGTPARIARTTGKP